MMQQPASDQVAPHNFERFGDFNPYKLWPYFRDRIQTHVLKDMALVLPYLQDANLYDLQSVIVRQPRSTAAKMRKERAVYAPAGDILQLITKWTDECTPKFYQKWHVPQPVEVKGKNYRFLYSVTESDGEEKRAELYLKHPEKLVAPFLLAEDCVFDVNRLSRAALAFDVDPHEQLEFNDELYCIHESYKSATLEMHLHLHDNNNKTHYLKWPSLPIGFAITKYKLDKTGVVGFPTDLIRPPEFDGDWRLEPFISTNQPPFSTTPNKAAVDKRRN